LHNLIEGNEYIYLIYIELLKDKYISNTDLHYLALVPGNKIVRIKGRKLIAYTGNTSYSGGKD
jgi:hypothetical protein